MSDKTRHTTAPWADNDDSRDPASGIKKTGQVEKGSGSYNATATIIGSAKQEDGTYVVLATRTFAHLEYREKFAGNHVSASDAAIAWCFLQGAEAVHTRETYRRCDWPYNGMVRKAEAEQNAANM